MTSAQGQLATRKVSARYIHVSQPPGSPRKIIRTSGGIIASARALRQTAGVYMRANRLMKASLRLFLELAFSTRSSILLTVLSPNSLVVRMRSTPVMLIQPLIISSPALASRGRLSPVSAAVFRVLSPSVITPSMGTFSPGCTTMTVPTSTSSGSTFSSLPSTSMLA